MKAAVLSDIHGNLDALKAVLEDSQKEKADRIFICGDLAMAGPQPSETIDFLRKLSEEEDVTFIQGNTDEMIVKAVGADREKYTPPNKIMANALVYAQDVLNESQKEFLRELPFAHTETIGQIDVLFVHGSPRRNNEDILPNQPVDKIKEIIQDADEDLIFCGHTHMPAGYQLENQTVVNAGSVGRPFSEEPKACYVIFNYPDLEKSEYEIIHKFVDYDVASAVEKLKRQPFEGSEALAHMLEKATSRYP